MPLKNILLDIGSNNVNTSLPFTRAANINPSALGCLTATQDWLTTLTRRLTTEVTFSRRCSEVEFVTISINKSEINTNFHFLLQEYQCFSYNDEKTNKETLTSSLRHFQNPKSRRKRKRKKRRRKRRGKRRGNRGWR